LPCFFCAIILTDLREFTDAHQFYTEGLRAYRDVSPFPPAGVCFQLGVLWGELVPEPDTARAAQWYKRALDYFPSYMKARVHLAEIYSRRGQLSEALALLIPAIGTGDPEICWRLSDLARGSSPTQQRSCRRPGPVLKPFLSDTFLHVRTTVRSSTPEAVTISAERSISRVTTLQTAQLCVPSSKHMQSRLALVMLMWQANS
jgi:hypothetical protein